MVYRGMNIDKIAEGNWQWCDPRVDPEVMYGPFGSDEEAMADIDRHKKAQADARA